MSLNLARVGETTRLKLNHHAQRYCRRGGLPEIQKLSPTRSKEIAQSYVDAVVLRDVIDNGILDAYSTQITEDNGAFLENLVFITLRRRGHPLGYYETKKGHEIDFVYKEDETTVLVQVAWTLKNEATRHREVRALEEASKEFKSTQSIIVTLDEEWKSEDGAIHVLPLWQFLLRGIQAD